MIFAASKLVDAYDPVCHWVSGFPLNDIINEDLRVDYYDEVFDKLMKAKARVEDKNPPEYRSLVDNLLAILSLMDQEEKSDQLMQLGLSLGFNVAWLKKAKKQKTDSMVERAIKLKESLFAVTY